MQVEQNCWEPNTGWKHPLKPRAEVQLVLGFGSRQILENPERYQELKQMFPSAQIACCSTAGEIQGDQVLDDTLCITSITFEKVRISSAAIKITEASESFVTGQELAKQLVADDLSYVLILSDGLHVNGSDLAKGLVDILPPTTVVTGGLSGDADAFNKTVVGLNGQAESNLVVAIGFYGDSLKIAHGSLGGWDPFGPDRLVTRSSGNVLYELDGHSALELYEEYLGEYAAELPASGLLFPLQLHGEGETGGVVRTILGIDRDNNSLIFAGDIPEGSHARLMNANFHCLVNGAAGAAVKATEMFARAELAILISCVGRKLVLQQRIEDEVEAVQKIFGKDTVLTGFYSYGELSPQATNGRCELHNQTMTIATLFES
ncbi:MAG: hypothetical protein GY753_07335 [Gammaproteobacteria bacterium]|nr:hypothetical protein [Gammaproteobacteria bacterium]